MCRLGESNRITYFCSQCQKADPRLVNVRYDWDFVTFLNLKANVLAIGIEKWLKALMILR